MNATCRRLTPPALPLSGRRRCRHGCRRGQARPRVPGGRGPAAAPAGGLHQPPSCKDTAREQVRLRGAANGWGRQQQAAGPELAAPLQAAAQLPAWRAIVSAWQHATPNALLPQSPAIVPPHMPQADGAEQAGRGAAGACGGAPPPAAAPRRRSSRREAAVRAAAGAGWARAGPGAALSHTLPSRTPRALTALLTACFAAWMQERRL